MPDGRAETTNRAEPDTETFRLRCFVEELIGSDEIEICDEPVALADLTAHMDGNRHAVLFRNAGPEKTEIVGNLLADRSRLAAALGVRREDIIAEVLRRTGVPQEIIEVAVAQAPVQQIVWTGDDADFTRLPVPFLRANDGGSYLSATIDFVTNPETGLTNVGCRRMMLRGRREAGVDLTAPGDLRVIYEQASARGERLPVSFALGSHPADHIAATMRVPIDETQLVARMRGAALPVVKCVTNDVRVPADAEIILEGYFDAGGHVEAEGPFGEFAGYYGVMKQNPVFHLTAITMRRDALFQTVTISGTSIGRTDTTQLNAIKTEAVVWRALQGAIREPVAVHATTAGGGLFNLRLALHQRTPGEARNAIAAAFSCLANVKNVFVVDEDIDIFDDDQIEWALATRFQPDRDLVVQNGFRVVPVDPSLDGSRIGAKAGFDLTIPFGRHGAIDYSIPAPPELEGARFPTIEKALEDGPKTFEQLMAAVGSRDGRDVAVALAEFREAGRIRRLEEGEYALKDG